MRRRLLFITCFVALSTISAFTSVCDLKTFPEQLQSILVKNYAGWKVVTLAALDASDRSTWLDLYSQECPGVIKGKFLDDRTAYVLNLIKKQRGKIFQQVILFQDRDGGYVPLTVFPRTAIKTITVIRKFGPGKYRPANGGKALNIKTDTIGISQISAWTVVYYWDGTTFRHLVTSE